ncbi:hypothetical protein TanjilG_16816 [Lupinus angustifolius]|uniref:Protein MIZU-KUSSEI 1 n=1 Tax=Lupinus angustifolius TaxID=3871 RepID=A0A1J7H1E2_LUPAN|nr:PREDICTED: protein MIZU-KUSSEI 1 [Lupinus angustifolius]OIW06404.1 hypothetical protein TanjilG_16816 [Lupinus angustifolius]
MKQQKQNLTLQKRTNTTTTRSSRRITPSNHHTSDFDDVSNKLLIRQSSTSSIPSFHNHVVHAVADRNLKHCTRPASSNKLSYVIRSFLKLFTFPIIIPSWLTISSHLSITSSVPRKVTGTLFGNRHGHISFAVQLEPRSEPILLLQLAMTTFSLVKEMSSGLVRITLECEKSPATVKSGGRERMLFHEPTWTMYCNGKKCGYAVSRTCGDLDWHVLRTVQSVSVGAGVIPLLEENGGGSGESEGELTYMRARFERVIGSRNSESFYMLNPDGNGGPELSIFLLRI